MNYYLLGSFLLTTLLNVFLFLAAYCVVDRHVKGRQNAMLVFGVAASWIGGITVSLLP